MHLHGAYTARPQVMLKIYIKPCVCAASSHSVTRTVINSVVLVFPIDVFTDAAELYHPSCRSWEALVALVADCHSHCSEPIRLPACSNVLTSWLQ
jgi:hypothetical protein